MSRQFQRRSALRICAITGSEGDSITPWAPELNDHRDGWFGRIGDHRVPANQAVSADYMLQAERDLKNRQFAGGFNEFERILN
jgi:hypothetical protein